MFEAFFQPQPMDVANSNVRVFCAIRMSTSTLVARSKNTNDYVFVSIFNFRIGILWDYVYRNFQENQGF